MRKGTIVAVAVFAALLAVAVLRLDRKESRGIDRLTFGAIDKDAIDKVEIAGPNPAKLARKDGAWLLGDGKPAEANAVKALLEAVGKIDSSDLVTSNPDRFAELEVDDAKGTRVSAFAGDRLVAEFVVGKAGGGGVHVRKGDSVWAAKGVWPGAFSKKASAWHDLRVLTEKPEDVARVEVSPAGGAPWAMEQKDGRWALADAGGLPAGFRFDEGAARTMASALAGLSARELLDKDPGDEVSGLGAADRFALVLEDGARRELLLGKAREDKAVHAKVEGRPDVWALAEWTAKGLKRSPLELRDLSMTQLDRAKVKKLAIVSGKERLVLEKEGEGWKIASSTANAPEGFEPDPSRVEQRIGALASLRGTKLADLAPARAGLDRPSGSITATLDGGGSVAVQFGAALKDGDDDVFAARGNADGAVYYVGKLAHDDLLGGLETFKKQPPPQFNPSGLDQLPPDVRAKLLQQLQQQQGR